MIYKIIFANGKIQLMDIHIFITSLFVLSIYYPLQVWLLFNAMKSLSISHTQDEFRYYCLIRKCNLNNPYLEPVYTGWSSVHWNATGMPLVDPVYTGTPLEKLSWNSPTLGCHWRNSNFYSVHWNTTGGTVTAHTRPNAYSLAHRVASMPVWNDKMAGHQ